MGADGPEQAGAGGSDAFVAMLETVQKIPLCLDLMIPISLKESAGVAD
jgi:hypothetical protein